MSAIFGPIFQIGYVVRDIEVAMDHWVRVLGVGPFVFKPDVTFAETSYRGTKTNGMMSAVAHAFSGDLDIELIQQVSDTPSIYRDFLDEFGEGMQHLGVLVDNWDAQMELAGEQNLTPLQAGRTREGVRFAYFDNAAHHPGTMIEFIEHTPAFDAFIKRARMQPPIGMAETYSSLAEGPSSEKAKRTESAMITRIGMHSPTSWTLIYKSFQSTLRGKHAELVSKLSGVRRYGRNHAVLNDGELCCCMDRIRRCIRYVN
jgi:hypothetical protein